MVSPVQIQVPLPFPTGRQGRPLGSSLGDVDAPSDLWRVGQEVKTPPFHGGNMGSIPIRVTIFPSDNLEA